MSPDENVARVASYWKDKAFEALAAARDELAAGRHGFAMNRCYYACFYAASAVFLKRGISFRKHTGVRAAVHKELVHPGVLSVDDGKVYDRLFVDRQEGDYVEFVEFAPEDVAEAIEGASALVAKLVTLAGLG